MELVLIAVGSFVVTYIVCKILSNPKEVSRILIEQGNLKEDGRRVGIYKIYEITYEDGSVKLETIES